MPIGTAYQRPVHAQAYVGFDAAVMALGRAADNYGFGLIDEKDLSEAQPVR
jgi:hypothetical protein